MLSETDFMTSHLVVYPAESLAGPASPSAGQIVLSESTPFAPSEANHSDSDSDCDDLPPSPTLSWATAAKDALEGIHYVRQRFPNDHTAYLAAPFRREPLSVEADDRVLILDEVSEFIVRVRLLRTDAVGVLPVWNVEGALERLARENMELNEIVTCPSEDSRQASPASHVCNMPRKQHMLTRRYSMDSDDTDADADLPPTPTSPATALPHKSRSSPTQSRKVGFTSSPRKTIFRYFAPRDLDDQWESEVEEEEDKTVPENEDGDVQWWWNGWEESHDAPEHNPEDCALDEEEEASSSDDDIVKPVRLVIRRPEAFMSIVL